MEKQRSARLKVGIFILASIVIFVYGVFTISGQEELFEREYKVKTYLITQRDCSRCLRATLGSGCGFCFIHPFFRRSLPREGSGRDGNHKRALSRISKDSHATIKTEGFWGRNSSKSFPGQGESIGRARDGIVIKGYTSPEMQEIISQSEEFVTNLTAISRNLDKIVGGVCG